MSRYRPKIIFIGGGSYAWVPNAVKDLMYHPALMKSEVVLHDIDLKAAKFNKQFIEKINEKLGVSPRISVTGNLNNAIKDADYVVVTVAVGGLKAMSQDIKLPEKFGIYHTVGDTTGPGGWIRTIRHFELFKKLGETINRLASNALILNYTNPMATLTDVLSRMCPGRVVGLCHGLFDNINFIREAYNVKPDKPINVHYGGINHFIWFTKVSAGQVDVIKDLRRKLRTKTLDDIKHGQHTDAMGFSSRSAVATELFQMTGVMPYIGDRHTCEFFSWYLTSPEKMKAYNLERTSIPERRKKNNERLKKFRSWLKKEIPDHVFQHSRETAANIIDAHYTGIPFVDVGNVPNTGQINNLPLGAVVETAVQFDRNGITPLSFGALPEIVEGFIRPWTTVYKQLVDACFADDFGMAINALRLDPVCSHLEWKEVRCLAEELVKRNRTFINGFKNLKGSKT